jgi:hypothetical protein
MSSTSNSHDVVLVWSALVAVTTTGPVVPGVKAGTFTGRGHRCRGGSPPGRSQEDIAPLHGAADAVDLLVDHGRMLGHRARRGGQHQAPVLVETERGCTRHPEAELLRVGPRDNDEVVLQLALVAVVDDVDARVGPFHVHLGVGGGTLDPVCPVATLEVVDAAGQLLAARHN